MLFYGTYDAHHCLVILEPVSVAVPPTGAAGPQYRAPGRGDASSSHQVTVIYLDSTVADFKLKVENF